MKKYLWSIVMFTFFEKRINPYPEAEPAPPPSGLIAFCLKSIQNKRPFHRNAAALTHGLNFFHFPLRQSSRVM